MVQVVESLIILKGNQFVHGSTQHYRSGRFTAVENVFIDKVGTILILIISLDHSLSNYLNTECVILFIYPKLFQNKYK